MSGSGQNSTSQRTKIGNQEEPQLCTSSPIKSSQDQVPWTCLMLGNLLRFLQLLKSGFSKPSSLEGQSGTESIDDPANPFQSTKILPRRSDYRLHTNEVETHTQQGTCLVNHPKVTRTTPRNAHLPSGPVLYVRSPLIPHSQPSHIKLRFEPLCDGDHRENS